MLTHERTVSSIHWMVTHLRLRYSMANLGEPRSKQHLAPRGSGRSCLVVLGLTVLGTTWFAAAQLAVIWYNNGCTSTVPGMSSVAPGMALLIIPLLLAGWLTMVTYTIVSARWRHRVRVNTFVYSILVLVGALLITWGYWSIIIPSGMDPAYFEDACGGEHPPRWPPIPIPKPGW